MDPISTAIIAALSAGAASGLTEASKTAITDAYSRLKDLVARKFGSGSDVVQAIDQLETKPASSGRREMLEEEISEVQAIDDEELLAAAKHVLTLVQPQQAGMGKFTIQNTGPVQGQVIGDHPQVTQHFGDLPSS